MAWYWIFLIVYSCLAVFLGLLGLFVKPLRVVFRGFLCSFCFVFEAFYLVFVWWWLALFRLAFRRSVPSFLLFRRFL